MNLDQLDAPEPFEPDDRFRSDVRRRGRVLRHRRRRRIGAAVTTPVVVAAAALAWVDSRLDRVESIEVAMPGSDVADGGPVDILVVGTDAGLPGQEGEPNADAIALVRFDTAAGAVRVLPLHRDLVAVDGDGMPSRLSNVRASSGPDGLIAAIERLLRSNGEGVGIDHYVELDTAALRGLVDAVGGVPFHNDHDGLRDELSGLNLEQGCHLLDGEEFVALARSRRPTDANGRDLSNGRGDLHRIESNVTLGASLAASLLAAEPTPEALLTFLGPVVEGMAMDSELSLRRLVDLGWAARNHLNEAGLAPIVLLPVEVDHGGEGGIGLALAEGWEMSLRTWKGTADTAVGAPGPDSETTPDALPTPGGAGAQPSAPECR